MSEAVKLGFPEKGPEDQGAGTPSVPVPALLRAHQAPLRKSQLKGRVIFWMPGVVGKKTLADPGLWAHLPW